jgi:hypothetical protein
MIRALTIVLCLTAPALADPVADAEAARLQAAEAAVRAGQTSPRPVTRIVRPVERATSAPDSAASLGSGRGADGFFPLRRETTREFPLPPRNESLPSGAAVQALVAAGQATPLPPKDSDKAAREARDTAAGLKAIQDFRHDHGLQ